MVEKLRLLKISIEQTKKCFFLKIFCSLFFGNIRNNNKLYRAKLQTHNNTNNNEIKKILYGNGLPSKNNSCEHQPPYKFQCLVLDNIAKMEMYSQRIQWNSLEKKTDTHNNYKHLRNEFWRKEMQRKEYHCQRCVGTYNDTIDTFFCRAADVWHCIIMVNTFNKRKKKTPDKFLVFFYLLLILLFIRMNLAAFMCVDGFLLLFLFHLDYISFAKMK